MKQGLQALQRWASRTPVVILKACMSSEGRNLSTEDNACSIGPVYLGLIEDCMQVGSPVDFSTYSCQKVVYFAPYSCRCAPPTLKVMDKPVWSVNILTLIRDIQSYIINHTKTHPFILLGQLYDEYPQHPHDRCENFQYLHFFKTAYNSSNGFYEGWLEIKNFVVSMRHIAI